MAELHQRAVDRLSPKQYHKLEEAIRAKGQPSDIIVRSPESEIVGQSYDELFFTEGSEFEDAALAAAFFVDLQTYGDISLEALADPKEVEDATELAKEVEDGVDVAPAEIVEELQKIEATIETATAPVVEPTATDTTPATTPETPAF